MNVLIIIPHSDFVPTLPLGPLSIASHLNSHGHTARICDCLLNKNEYKKYLTAETRPDLVAISLMSYSGWSTRGFFRVPSVPLAFPLYGAAAIQTPITM